MLLVSTSCIVLVAISLTNSTCHRTFIYHLYFHLNGLRLFQYQEFVSTYTRLINAIKYCWNLQHTPIIKQHQKHFVDIITKSTLHWSFNIQFYLISSHLLLNLKRHFNFSNQQETDIPFPHFDIYMTAALAAYFPCAFAALLARAVVPLPTFRFSKTPCALQQHRTQHQ